jgi:hypothetical protein
MIQGCILVSIVAGIIDGHCFVFSSRSHEYNGRLSPAIAPWQTFLIVTIRPVHMLLCASLHNSRVRLSSLEPYPIDTNPGLGS